MSQLDKIISLTARLVVATNHIKDSVRLLTELAEQAETREEKKCFCALAELFTDHLLFYNEFVGGTKERMPEHMKNEIDTKVIAYKNNVSC